MSAFPSSLFSTHTHPSYSQQQLLFHNHPHSTPHNTIAPYEPTIYHQALAQLQHQPAFSGNSSQRPHDHNNTSTIANPHIRVHQHSQASSPPSGTSGTRSDSGIAGAGVAAHDWQFPMQAQVYNSMGGPVTALNRGVKRARSHQRTPSASTVASNGPNSPYAHTASYPLVANTDQAPNSPSFYADQALFPKNLPTPSHTPVDGHFSSALYMPSQAAHMPNAHHAMKSFGINHHTDEYLPDFAPSRQSMSSYGTDSPATPQSGAGDMDSKSYSIPPNDYTRQNNPNVQLYRTESAAFQDELYDPNAVFTSAPPKLSTAHLSPHAHRNLLGERLQHANMLRSASPSSGISRDRSPFRDGSPLAPTQDWKSQGGPVGSAASMRQQQMDEAAQVEYAQHRAPLRREPTKTISPKDAVLDYPDNDQQPLFQDNIPAGYEKHMGGTEQWPSNTYGASFGDVMTTTGQPNMSFRGATADAVYSGSGFDYTNGLPPQGQDQVQSNPFHAHYQAALAKMNNYAESTPDFPATIPSMETSISDTLPPSSQESNTNGYTSMPQRPDDTRANTGTYTCTYHGCTQRFDSHGNLQKHKRDYHRSQQPARDTASSPGTAGSMSPRSTESPAPSTSGMTSAAILARNTQAGPHKCTRINPSTNKPCNTIFSRPYDLTRHEDTIHNNRKQKVRCPMCREEKTFSRNDALTRHMRVVRPEVDTLGKRGRRE